jgi:hypothetical protein
MITVCKSVDLNEVIETIANDICIEISNTLRDNYYGNVCYSNYYWYKLGNLERIYQKIYNYLSDTEFIFILKELCDHDIEIFGMLDGYINCGNCLYYEEIFMYLRESTDDLEEIYDDLQSIIQDYYILFSVYEKVVEANAKATIIKALYNPHTKIGKIHCNALYDVNFT